MDLDVTFSYRAKGAGGLASRAGTILSRFGVTAGAMERYLSDYSVMTSRFDVRPTLPITASVLARHPSLIARFVERGVEFAIHGMVHNDHAALSLDEQCESIARARTIFEAAGVPCAGFRGPYLRYNAATHDAIRSVGLSYDCSQAVTFPVLPRAVEQGPGATRYRRALELYRALNAERVAVRPRNRCGLIDIPVAIPDDEIMVDRLHLDARAQAAAWLSILDTTHARGDLFTVQLHPERFPDCASALEAVLEAARRRQSRVWFARLEEIASWWRRRQQMTLHVQELGDDRLRVHLEGGRDASLLVRGLSTVDASPWVGRDRVAEVHTFEVSGRVKPVVGVSPRSPKHVLDFLREEGLPTEVSSDHSLFGAYLDVAPKIAPNELDEAGLLAEVERAPGPLVRLWRWPLGARSALAVTGDIDSITLQDFAFRVWETYRRTPPGPSRARGSPRAESPGAALTPHGRHNGLVRSRGRVSHEGSPTGRCTGS
jgi:peptidoglycan/xylan/chitin deacetylase (PgdA/CDA1 family)